MTDFNNQITQIFEQSVDSLHKSISLKTQINDAINLIINSIKNGNKLIIFGNGGSAADAQHIAAELVGRFKSTRKALPAIALTTDSSSLTSIGNDFGFAHVFERQIEALANDGDVIIGISTSGNSVNVINGIKLGSELNCNSIGFTGLSSGEFNKICNINIVAPSNDTARIQELHILIGHTICHLIDLEFK